MACGGAHSSPVVVDLEKTRTGRHLFLNAVHGQRTATTWGRQVKSGLWLVTLLHRAMTPLVWTRYEKMRRRDAADVLACFGGICGLCSLCNNLARILCAQQRWCSAGWRAGVQMFGVQCNKPVQGCGRLAVCGSAPRGAGGFIPRRVVGSQMTSTYNGVGAPRRRAVGGGAGNLFIVCGISLRFILPHVMYRQARETL